MTTPETTLQHVTAPCRGRASREDPTAKGAFGHTTSVDVANAVERIAHNAGEHLRLVPVFDVEAGAS